MLAALLTAHPAAVFAQGFLMQAGTYEITWFSVNTITEQPTAAKLLLVLSPTLLPDSASAQMNPSRGRRHRSPPLRACWRITEGAAAMNTGPSTTATSTEWSAIGADSVGMQLWFIVDAGSSLRFRLDGDSVRGVIFSGAGLFVRSLRNVRAIDLGFDSQGLVTVHASYRDVARSREVGPALESIAEEMSRVPGVRSVAMASGAPMQGSRGTRLFLPGRDSMPTVGGIPPLVVFVSPEYFSTVGARLVAGRTLESTDRVGMAPVAVVGRTMARVVWPGENPIGKCILPLTRSAPCTTVVGVVDDMHADNIIEPKPFMLLYLPFAQNVELDSLRFGMSGIERVLLVRTRPGTEGAVMQPALRIARERLPGVHALRVNDMAQVLEPKLRPWRLGATLFSALGLLAAVVAVIGVYSVIAYSASQRSHEMSVRMALGARGHDIITLVAGEGLRVILISITIGIAATFAMSRLVASLLYGVSASDPVVLAGAALLLALMAFAAILTPALRAARSDPASALRSE